MYLQPYLGAMQLGEVGPAGHGVELRLRLDQIYDSFASIAWQSGSTLIQQFDNSSCITLPACASLWCLDQHECDCNMWQVWKMRCRGYWYLIMLQQELTVLRPGAMAFSARTARIPRAFDSQCALLASLLQACVAHEFERTCLSEHI